MHSSPSGARYWPAPTRVPPKHNGITYFLLDMKSPGVEVKPLRELTGDALFNTVFIDDVFVPDSMVLGEVDRGWEVSRNTLTNERVSIGSGEPPFLASLDQFVAFLAEGQFDQIEQNHAGKLIAEATPPRCSTCARRCSPWPVAIRCPPRPSPNCCR